MTRRTMTNRRLADTFDFHHDGHHYTASVGYFGDGRLAEIFMATGKPGSAMETVARDCAVAVSLALQHGTTLDVLRKAMTRDDGGGPAGPMARALDLVAAA